MPQRLYEITFIGSAVALVALVGIVNCLQGTPFIGAMKCSYTFTSADLIVKILATIIFLLLVGLLLGPIAITLIHPPAKKEQKTTNP
jgi:hypothetical protein